MITKFMHSKYVKSTINALWMVVVFSLIAGCAAFPDPTTGGSIINGRATQFSHVPIGEVVSLYGGGTLLVMKNAVTGVPGCEIYIREGSGLFFTMPSQEGLRTAALPLTRNIQSLGELYKNMVLGNVYSNMNAGEVKTMLEGAGYMKIDARQLLDKYPLLVTLITIAKTGIVMTTLVSFWIIPFASTGVFDWKYVQPTQEL